MKLTVTLLNEQREEVTSQVIDSAHIAKVACIVYKGRYFVYQQITATTIYFGEVDAPFVLEQ